MNERRALLLTMDFPPTRGGIQTVARELVARANHTRFRIIAPADDGFDAVDATARFPTRRVRRVASGRRGFVPTLAVAAATEIRRTRPDVVLALHALAAPGALLRARVPVVLVVYAGELRSPRIRRIASWALPRAERVIAISRFTRSEAIACGANPLRITVLPVGGPDPIAVDSERTDALRARLGGGQIVLSVARLEPHKGHDRLIAALDALPAETRIVLVGEGSARASLTEQARALGVADRVIFAGAVDDDELPVYFHAADVFAMLSRATHGERAGVEGGGIALLEAGAYGLPIVAGRTGGVPETIQDGRTGLLVDPEDQAAVNRVLARALGDATLAASLGAAAKVVATGERSWGAFVERMEQVLDAAARRSAEDVG